MTTDGRGANVTGTGPGSWQPDPEGRYEYRWWDGQSWTDQVSHQGQMSRSPLGGAPVVESPAAVQTPQASAPEQYVPQQRAPQQATVTGDGFAGISGDLVDGRFSEKEAKPIANQNSK